MRLCALIIICDCHPSMTVIQFVSKFNKLRQTDREKERESERKCDINQKERSNGSRKREPSSSLSSSPIHRDENKSCPYRCVYRERFNAIFYIYARLLECLVRWEAFQLFFVLLTHWLMILPTTLQCHHRSSFIFDLMPITISPDKKFCVWNEWLSFSLEWNYKWKKIELNSSISMWLVNFPFYFDDSIQSPTFRIFSLFLWNRFPMEWMYLVFALISCLRIALTYFFLSKPNGVAKNGPFLYVNESFFLRHRRSNRPDRMETHTQREKAQGKKHKRTMVEKKKCK